MRYSRISRSAGWAVAPMFVFLTVAASFGAVLFEDSFTDQAAFNSKWANSLDNSMMTATVNGGSGVINNTSEYTGEFIHTFSAPKPSTFTISFVLKSVQGEDAGVFFCRSSGFNGYYLTSYNGKVSLYKYVNGTGNTIYNQGSVDINASNNKFTVSKNSGGEIHLFVNDAFQGKVTDNTFSSGDVSLLISESTTATFGAFSMTDEFTEGGLRTSFSDNFNSGRSKYWNFLNSGSAPTISDAGGALNVTTGTDVWSWNYVDIALPTDFEVSVAVRHVDGGAAKGDFYGIILLGDPPAAGGPIPMMSFGITGNKRFSLWGPREGNAIPEPELNSIIRGSSGDAAVVYIDTLLVRKKTGATAYEFIVNGEPLSVDYGVVNFAITGVGIFSSGGMTIAYDNFEAKAYGSTSIKFGNNPQSVRGSRATQNIAVVKNALNLNVNNNAVVRIFGLNGRELRQISLVRGNHTVQLGNLPKGMYMANVVIDGERKALRVPVR